MSSRLRGRGVSRAFIHRCIPAALAALAFLLALAGPRRVEAVEPLSIHVSFQPTGTSCTEALAKGPNRVESLVADGTRPITLCAHIEHAVTGADEAGRAVEFRVTVGTVGVSGIFKYSGPVFSTSTGVSQISYRGDGQRFGADTVVVSCECANSVATTSILLTPPAGIVASRLAVTQGPVGPVAADDRGEPGYASPLRGAHVAVQAQDWRRLGVNGQRLLVTAERGLVVANPGLALSPRDACAGAPERALVLTTAATEVLVTGGIAMPGAADFTACADRETDAEEILVTVEGVGGGLAPVTVRVPVATRPAAISATVNAGVVTAIVTDARGRAVADGTPVRFTLAAPAGTLSTRCQPTAGGVVTAVLGLDAAESVVLAAADFNRRGVASSCAIPGSEVLGAEIRVSRG